MDKFYIFTSSAQHPNDTLNVQLERDGEPIDMIGVEVRGDKARHPRGSRWISRNEAVEIMQAILQERNPVEEPL